VQQQVTICAKRELEKASSLLNEILRESERNVVLLNGQLGAGKTAFVKHFILNKNENVEADSPTFSIVNDYNVNNEIIHHFDLYRLKSIDEIEDFGFWDYIDSGNLCFIEWPDKIADLLPQNQVITVDIALTLEQCREFTFYY
jgi:tRNA threonylcarbamoyladenosine biosynthesis protein TsaE